MNFAILMFIVPTLKPNIKLIKPFMWYNQFKVSIKIDKICSLIV